MNALRLVLLAASFPTLAVLPALGVATTTTLAISPVDAGDTIVPARTPITLTATVRVSGVPVTRGAVLFCDATAVYCTDIHQLGAVQLNNLGVAILRTIPRTGAHHYKAMFAGTASSAGSASDIVAATVTHSRQYATTTAIVETGKIGNYTLSASVGSAADIPPSGTLSFVDTSNGDAVVANLPLSGPYTLSFADFQQLPALATPYHTATADFNGDGLLDLAVAYSNAVTVLLGDGSGKFVVSYKLAAPFQPLSIAATDLNGDGILDLVAANSQGASPTILIGQGNGKFLQALSPTTGGGYSHAVAVGDFNGDGIPDLALPNYNSGTLSVLLGNGTGLFPTGTSTPVGLRPIAIVTADFNGDHLPDVAIASNYGDRTYIFLGKGDGTFTAAQTIHVKGSRFLAVADFNEDGIADLAITDALGVQTYLGAGDGTFTLKQNYVNQNQGVDVEVSDFNGDGVADLVLAGHDGNLTALLGVGDGTFLAQPPWYDSAPYRTMLSAIPGDFDGDGVPDLAVATHGRLSIFLTQPQTATVRAENIAFPVATGVHQVVAEYSGDSVGLASSSPSVALGTAQGIPVDSLLSLSSATSYGTPVTLIASITGSGSTPTGMVNFIDGAVPIGSVPVNSSGIASLTTGTLSPASHAILSIYSGDANYASVYSNTVAVTVAVGAQKISFASIPTQSVGNPLRLSATATSGLPVNFVSQTPTVCRVTGSAATLFAVGSCTIEAVQAGNLDYLPAPPVKRSFEVSLAGTTTIDFTSGFAQAPGLIDFNGSVGLDGLNLRMTGTTAAEAGSAFYAAPVSIAQFTTYFTFQLSTPTAEGITFTIQNMAPTALGGGSGSLGYAGIVKSVAIKFDPHDDAGEGNNSTGLYVRGIAPDVPAANLTGSGIDLHSGHLMTFFAVYDKKVLYASITDLQTHVKYTTKWGVDIPSIVGGPTAYVGFTGSTGAVAAPQEVTSWKYLTSLPVR